METRLHAWILSGTGEAAKNRARQIAAARLCEKGPDRACGVCRHCRKILQGAFPGIHPDVIAVERQPGSKGTLRREITVDQIRALAVDALVLPNEAAGKVYILPEADAMNVSAQNAFLKLLEEPPENVFFLLCAANREALLPTVRSRCGEERLVRSETPDAGSLERAKGFLEARRDSAELLRWSLAMERLDAAALAETLECIRALAVRQTAGSPELLPLEAFLARAEQYLRANVGIKHVTGYLATYEYDSQRQK